MSEFDFVAALIELQANDQEGYELVVETILRLREKQNEKEQ
nr:hypothetical protein [uncultured Terrisporobacter sp.]